MSQLTLIVGAQGTGKSTLINTLVVGIAESKGRRSLIIDPGQAKAYAAHGFITEEEIPHFRDTSGGAIKRISDIVNKKKLIARIFGFDLETGRIYRHKAFVNGNLVMEDAKSYINSNMTESLIEAIKSFKQYGLSLILCYHTIEEISPDILDLGPHHIFLKRTGDGNVFSKIRKARRLGNYAATQKAFYEARFFGRSWQTLMKEIPPDELDQICRDLDLKGQGAASQAKELAKFVTGKINPTVQEKDKSAYEYRYVKLR